MSDPRIESAKAALANGAFDKVIQSLKPLLAEMPDNMEVRAVLTEAQEGMMLRLQLTQKVKKAADLMAAGDTESAKKTVSDILKLDPTNPEALDIQRALNAPPVDDLSSTVDFGVTDQAFEDAISAPIHQDRGSSGLDELEDFSLPMEGFQQEFPASPAESTKSSTPAGTPGNQLQPMELEDFGESAQADQFPLGGGPAMEDFGAAPHVEPFPSQPAPAEATVLSSEAVAPFSLGGEVGKAEAFIAEGRGLISQGKYQEAIDVLTRVFILDEENQEAQKLIDQAKELEVNRDREINVILNEAISAYDAKDNEKAKSLFLKVLILLPGHREADYYLKELEKDSGAIPAFQLETPSPSSSGFELDGSPGEFSFDASSGASDEGLASLVGGHSAPAPPPAAPAEPAAMPDLSFQTAAPPAGGPAKAPAVKKPVKAGGRKAPVGMIAAIIGGLLLVSSLFFIGPMIWEKLFTPKPKAMSIPQTKPAKPTTDASQKPQVPVTPQLPQKSFAELVAEAKTAMQEKQYDKAVNLFLDAEKLDKNDMDLKMSLQNAKEALAKQQEEAVKNQKFITDFEKASQYFKLQEYGEALRISWRLIYPDDTLAKQMGKADAIRKIIRNGYYNWGVKELKSGNPAAASKNFKDLVEFTPDPKGRELWDFSKKYSNNTIDEKYRSYVQELSFRSIEE